MPSMKSKINSYNHYVRGKFDENQESNARLCNCIEPDNCPLNGNELNYMTKEYKNSTVFKDRILIIL